ncbi:MAG: hypothetical protein ABWY06_00335 [Pseudomonas sp.]|uniref:hypothetical protein n=1 Tax=Pseudomonas sp. TaxID=306 RepID=UPI00339A9A31
MTAPDDEVLIEHPMIWMVALMALAVGLFLLDSRLTGYSILLMLIASVIFGVRRRKYYPLGSLFIRLIAVTQLLAIVLANFSESIPGVIKLMSGFFDDYLSLLMLGVSWMSEDLIADGYFDRVVEIKGFSAVIFLVSVLLARGYLVAAFSVGEVWKKIKAPLQEDKNWLNRNLVLLIFVVVFAAVALYMDWYNPKCTKRCMQVEVFNFPIFSMLSVTFSMTFFFIGLMISAYRVRAVRLKYGKKDQVNE